VSAICTHDELTTVIEPYGSTHSENFAVALNAMVPRYVCHPADGKDFFYSLRKSGVTLSVFTSYRCSVEVAGYVYALMFPRISISNFMLLKPALRSL
jgi:hypothetical protein